MMSHLQGRHPFPSRSSDIHGEGDQCPYVDEEYVLQVYALGRLESTDVLPTGI